MILLLCLCKPKTAFNTNIYISRKRKTTWLLNIHFHTDTQLFLLKSKRKTIWATFWFWCRNDLLHIYLQVKICTLLSLSSINVRLKFLLRRVIKMMTRWRSLSTMQPSWTSSSLRWVYFCVEAFLSFATKTSLNKWRLFFCVHLTPLSFFQIEDIRNSIDKIDENVAEVKKLYSVILSAPTSDQSKTSFLVTFVYHLCSSFMDSPWF